MAILKKNNLLLISSFLIFCALLPKLTLAENSNKPNEQIADSYYKKYLRDYYYSQGKQFYSQGRYREATFKFKSALQCDPDYKPAATFVELIEARNEQQQRVEELKISGQKGRKNEFSKEYFSRYYFHQGVSYFNKSRYQDAMERFKEALKWVPDYKPALKYLVLSEDRIAQQSKLKQEKILTSDQKEENEAKEQFAIFYCKQGRDYFDQRKYSEAIANFRHALEAYPQYKQALKYITLSEGKILAQNKLEQEKKISEKKNKEEQDKRKGIEAAKKKIEEEKAQEAKKKAQYGETKAREIEEKAQEAKEDADRKQKHQELRKLIEKKRKEAQEKREKRIAAQKAAQEKAAQEKAAQEKSAKEKEDQKATEEAIKESLAKKPILKKTPPAAVAPVENKITGQENPDKKNEPKQ